MIFQALEASFYTNRINQADVLTIQSEVASNEAQLLILKNQREAEIYKLNKLLGRKLDSKEFLMKDFEIDTLELSQLQLRRIAFD